jgi:protocatechuate 3,4-dioxygenase beta subunit
VRRSIDQAKTALESGKSTTAILTDTSFLPVHEWPRFRKLIRDSAQFPPMTIISAQEPGEPLTISGRVVDGSRRPVKAALMYVYQTSSKGWYSDRAAHVGAVEGDRKHARLFGYLKTDAEGRFEIRTIRPAGYPDSDLPAHIHVEVEAPDRPAGGLVTEIQFDDDLRLTAAWRKRSGQEGFVIAKVTTDSEKHKRVEVELRTH